VEAGEGRVWQPDTVDRHEDGPRYVTQRRWIALAAAALGIAPDLRSAVADGIALLLGIVGMVHRRARREFAMARCLEERGAAIGGLLDGLELNAVLLPKLLTAGHHAGIWRQPLFWDPRTGQRRSLYPARASPG
jgi:hypothetical protein